MPPWAELTLVAFGLVLAMGGAWAAVMRGAPSGWIDATWSFAVGAAAVAAALVPTRGWPYEGWRPALVALLAAVWSVRLGTHIARRAARGGNDPRYEALRKEWGAAAGARLFWFLQVQAAAGLVLAATAFLAAHNPRPELGLRDWLGVLIFTAAVVGEGVSDRELARFGRNPANRGKICERGLWSWSRHPNYFFEWLGWLAYAVIAVDLSGAYAAGWLALAGPAMMYGLLVHVSGIPPLEKHMLERRGDVFRDYQRRVNAFWPWPSRGDSGENAA